MIDQLCVGYNCDVDISNWTIPQIELRSKIVANRLERESLERKLELYTIIRLAMSGNDKE